MESSNSKSEYEERLIYPLSNQNTPSSNVITPQNGVYGFENIIYSPKIISKDSNTFLLNSHPLSCKEQVYVFIILDFWSSIYYSCVYTNIIVYIKS